ncbi:hypothetical protein OA79_03360 [Marinomonas sp. TW1]|nr:hypothetical protein OA79_03360 [Marinomonas sp. TW1]
MLLRALIILLTFSRMAYAEEQKPNFAVGLGYGLLESKSLLNIDFKVNIPINDYFSTQVLLNSNYLITGSSKDSFAQSELFSNWFFSNQYARLGVGLGVSELEPMDEAVKGEREVIGQFTGDVFFDDVTLIVNTQSNQATLSNITSSRLGISYYQSENVRFSLYREKYNDLDTGWRFESYYQPEKYHDMASVGVIVRTGKQYDYIGAVIQYYFDYDVTLQERERHFN